MTNLNLAKCISFEKMGPNYECKMESPLELKSMSKCLIFQKRYMTQDTQKMVSTILVLDTNNTNKKKSSAIDNTENTDKKE